jgi:hypothetical protein
MVRDDLANFKRVDQHLGEPTWGLAMSSGISRYWPFDVGRPELHTDQEKSEVRFLETADDLGYRPYELGLGSYGATGTDGRVADIIWRGRNRWEIAVGDAERRVAGAFVDDFQCAAEAALDWLGGGQESDIVDRIEKHQVIMPGSRADQKLRG